MHIIISLDEHLTNTNPTGYGRTRSDPLPIRCGVGWPNPTPKLPPVNFNSTPDLHGAVVATTGRQARV